MDGLISLTDAAKVLAVKPETLRKWVQKKQISYYDLGKPKFKRTDLERFIELHRVQAVRRVKEFKPRRHKAA